jgi:hypothetical protein
MCPICGKRFSLASLEKHVNRCFDKFEEAERAKQIEQDRIMAQSLTGGRTSNFVDLEYRQQSTCFRIEEEISSSGKGRPSRYVRILNEIMKKKN